ncbi:hypothetical protein QBC47DRAFT_315246 [Echria macrotheca]|uniref:SNARE-complex protein Syntaxin-18 N-terminal domain-containing protein n=1 Tax=Echria macrotheca TaxID=438768 RepID=A0AAJ0BNI7_9PEZI|nr:hypothetical protein QBC47DRAFT_315246 [Echria macrotheca]
MSDLTPIFDTLLKGREAPPTKRPPEKTTDEFLNEAYRICTLVTQLHTQLRGLRQAYLSTANPRRTHLRTVSSSTSPPLVLTDRDREEIDANAKLTLRDLNARIRALEDAEQLRQSTEAALLAKRFSRSFGGKLGAWAAGSGVVSSLPKSAEHVAAEAAARQVGAHRESVILYLRQRLQEVARTQQRMMETRLAREIEKSRSIPGRGKGAFAMAGGGGGQAGVGMGGELGSAAAAAAAAGGGGVGFVVAEEDEEERRRRKRMSSVGDQNLTAEQRQMFEKGNQDMLQHFETTLDKVRTAEKSLVEISELQNLLVSNLATQSAHIDQLVAESFETTEGVGKGNTELKKSAARASPARYTFLAATGLCAFLVIWDLVI